MPQIMNRELDMQQSFKLMKIWLLVNHLSFITTTIQNCYITILQQKKEKNLDGNILNRDLMFGK